MLAHGGFVALLLVVIVAAASAPGTSAEEIARSGEEIYRELCASCHGEKGEGVPGEHSRPLVGDESVSGLAKYIDSWMPDDDSEKCTGEDAEKVARYIYDAFYSPIARARNRPPRIELSRLTVRQYRNAVADLVGSFRKPAPESTEQGLRGQYFDSRRPRGRPVVQRIDPEVRFDFGESSPAQDKLDASGFSARWDGAVLAPETGRYEFIVRTDHAARLWINDLEDPLIDAWVKSGDDIEYRASVFLIDGRIYPLRLEFTSRDQGVEKKSDDKQSAAFLNLCWKLPKRVDEVIPSRCLSPERTSEVLAVETPFPPDDRSSGYERGTSVSRAWDAATTDAALEVAGHITGHLDELAGTGNGDADRGARLRAFCASLVERAFRRPLTEEQRKLYVTQQFEAAPDLETAVKRVVLLALKSPRFLYLDTGDRMPDAYGVAAHLSFALWDSLPDNRLLEAAADGRITSREQVRREAERMVGDRRAHAKLLQFLHHWLDIEHVPDLVKDTERFSGFDAALASDLRTSLDLLLEEVLAEDGADFRKLLLSEELYLNGRLAAFYGHDLPAPAPFQKVRAKEAQRVGVLSHPYMMARFSYTDATSPIHRGVFLLRGVLGRALRPPPAAFAPLPAELHPDLTTRERVSLQTKPESCQACHSRINPLGFALEHFDAVGRYREREGNRPIDAAGFYESTDGERVTFDGALELARFLASSGHVHRAFALQLFQHLVKQPAPAYGTELSEKLCQEFAAADFNVLELVVEIAVRSSRVAVEETSPGDEPATGSPPPVGGQKATRV